MSCKVKLYLPCFSTSTFFLSLHNNGTKCLNIYNIWKVQYGLNNPNFTYLLIPFSRTNHWKDSTELAVMIANDLLRPLLFEIAGFRHAWMLHFMMTSSNGNIFCVTGHLCGEFTGPGEFPAQRPVTRSFDVFFDLRPNKRLSKQSWGWWFETLLCALWRHCNVQKVLATWTLVSTPLRNTLFTLGTLVAHFLW